MHRKGCRGPVYDIHFRYTYGAGAVAMSAVCIKFTANANLQMPMQRMLANLLGHSVGR